MMSDCRRGECGICALDVVACDGEIDHRDVFFSDAQRRESHKICACVSRASGHGDDRHALPRRRPARLNQTIVDSPDPLQP